ncbi:MAG: M18 family aminopeptidase [Erysipelotrichaceae bacterium]|nr:M18 family aminopeptidase [Erysipelotrichaceae bacterium]
MNYAKDCLSFIDASLSCFHAVHEISRRLEEKGYICLKEQGNWEIEKGGKYYTTRNQSSVIAFHVGERVEKPIFAMSSSHSDSPALKLKPQPVLIRSNMVRLNVEGYGGVMTSTWMDRPLSLAGRVMVKEENGFKTVLFEKKDCCLIPNTPPHLMRDGVKINMQVDMLPVLNISSKEFDINEFLAKEMKIEKEQILGFDMFVVNGESGKIWGMEEEFLSSARLDDLECAYGTLAGFLETENPERINVYCCFDNEEVGSRTRQGADSDFLSSTLERINESLGFSASDLKQGLTRSFMISADNAQALHPNHPEISDDVNQVRVNGGVVIKFNASQSYTSDGLSASVLKLLAEKAHVPWQIYTNRSDQRGGATLGNISCTHASVMSVDIGLAQWAMHSCLETAGCKDVCDLVSLMRTFYSSSLSISDEFVSL